MRPPPGLVIVEADLARHEDARDVEEMTETYARDPLGNGGPLPPDVLARLINGLRATPTAIVFLAKVDGRLAGIATCFRGFSTFQARPLINVHDLAVHPGHRGRGIGRELLRAVVAKARALGCCRVTLEVQERNLPARRLYEDEGFEHSLASTPAGGALFFAKHLDSPAVREAPD